MTENNLSTNMERMAGVERGSIEAAEVARDIASRSTATDVFDLLDALEFHNGEEWRRLFAEQPLVNGEPFYRNEDRQIRDLNRAVLTQSSRDITLG